MEVAAGSAEVEEVVVVEVHATGTLPKQMLKYKAVVEVAEVAAAVVVEVVAVVVDTSTTPMSMLK